MKAEQIKFRAWDEDGFMFEPEIIEFNKTHKGDTWIWQTDEEGNKIFGQLDSAVIDLMPFIGVCDKNGREIYEKDILAFGGYNLAVVFQKGEFVGKFREEIEDENIPGFIIRHEAHNFEIVGNVFENLELVSSTSILPKKS